MTHAALSIDDGATVFQLDRDGRQQEHRGRLGKQQRGAWVLTRHELWDMPVIFMLLVLFLCAEWGYRRWRDLI